jgi:hypothetical protein
VLPWSRYLLRDSPLDGKLKTMILSPQIRLTTPVSLYAYLAGLRQPNIERRGQVRGPRQKQVDVGETEE